MRMHNNFCKYYDGRACLIEKKPCSAGVNPKDLMGELTAGWFKRMPCNTENKTDVVCDKLELKTKEEIEKEEKEWDEAINRLTVVMPLISKLKKENPNGGWGAIECPNCKGVLHWSIASFNNHAHLKCETENCLTLME